jgi:hypothetical protein
MCDNALAGAVAIFLVMANAGFRNPIRLWPMTQTIVVLGAIVSLPGPVLRLGYLGVGGVELCLSARATSTDLWIWGIAIMLVVANCIISVARPSGKTRS